MLQSFSGWAGPNSSRHAMSPGISTYAIPRRCGTTTSNGQPIVLALSLATLPLTGHRAGVFHRRRMGRVLAHGSANSLCRTQQGRWADASVGSLAYLGEFNVQTTKVSQGKVLDLVFPSGLVPVRSSNRRGMTVSSRSLWDPFFSSHRRSFLSQPRRSLHFSSATRRSTPKFVRRILGATVWIEHVAPPPSILDGPLGPFP